jgi:NPCBM/NEW2 domain-containing protein
MRELLVRSPCLRSFPTACALLGVILIAGGKWTVADTVELVNGKSVHGIVRSVADGKVTLDVTPPAAAPVVEDKLFSAILAESTAKSKASAKKPAPKPADLLQFPLIDVVQIKFERMYDRANDVHPLINNEGARRGHRVSGSIKLREGYHRFQLIYWHHSGGPYLRLAYSRIERPNEDRQRFVSADMLAHLGGKATESASPGIDKEGYRLPEKLSGEIASNCSYTIRRRSDGKPLEKMGDVLEVNASVSDGTLDRISTQPFPNESDNLAMVLGGYLHITKDGLYKFSLSSDGGSQLFVGDIPSVLRLVDVAQASPPWSVTLVDGGTLKGTIEKWADSKIGLRISTGKSPVSLSIPVSRIARIWSTKAAEKEPATSSKKDDSSDRSSAPSNQDVVHAQSASGALQRVPCRAVGIRGESLAIQFGSQNRTIALSKVIGVELFTERAAAEGDQGFLQVLETHGGIKVPGRLISLDPAAATIRTQWGETLTLKTEDLTGVSIKNGKAISLAELKPSEITQVPFFERTIGYRVDESLSGGPILLRDGSHSRGISVHAKTVLRYPIGGRFQRFRTKLGFQLPEGELGDAAIRVLGDDKVLFERPSFRGDEPVKSLDLDVTGVGTLTLSVDFGRHEDVGDRVVWADPMLIRGKIGSVAGSSANPQN